MAENRARKPRADALRNRELLIEAARDVFARGGPEASLEAVARQAAVGIGTLYRHFPTREDLFHAVFSREMEQMVEMAEGLEGTNDQVEAVRGWLHSCVSMVETKRGMLGALSMVMTEDAKQTYAELNGRITAVVNHLLDAAAEGGQIREGVTAEDLLQTMYAFCYAREPGPDWRANVVRLLDIFVDGLKR